MTSPNTQLRGLLDFVLDGSCTDDEREQFAKLLGDNPDLMPELVQQVFVHSCLKWQLEESDESVGSLDLPELAPLSESADTQGRSSGTLRSLTTIASPAWFWVAAALLFVVASVSWLSIEGMNSDREAIAQIISQQGVKWTDADYRTDENGQEVHPGRLQTESGNFTMKFRSGPVVQVSGPTSMMIESDMLVHLDRGQATALVPQEAIGFSIKTPVIDVIDQGTEFGVAVRKNGHTDVVVFDGKVDLADGIGDEGVSRRLTRGEAARVNRQGAVERIMQVGRGDEGAWWTSDYPSSGINLIKRVWDNIPPEDGSRYFFYQVAYHGLGEDADAYVDHPHQWNGLSQEGLPKFLLKADFVKTFNDYRYKNDFEMVIEAARPVNLYVFFDDRVPTPSWLKDGFADTGIDIGLDEGPWEGIPDHRNAVGPGKSIDNVFSVWKRRCLDTTPVTLGPVGDSSEARAMYGIAATPLDLNELL